MKIGFVLCAAALSAVEIVKIPSTPYNERAIIKSMYAETGKLGGKKNPLVLQTVDFPLGVMAQGKTETLKGYRQNANGSTILLWVYGPGEQYRLSIVKQDATPFVENYAYFKDRIRKVLPVLTEYTVFAMFLNSYGESIKAGNAMKTLTLPKRELTQPCILYNEPYGVYRGYKEILLDFYVYNVDIGPDAHTVDVYIDGRKVDTLKHWAPYKIRDLPKGEYEVELVLINQHGKKVELPFGRQKEKIKIE